MRVADAARQRMVVPAPSSAPSSRSPRVAGVVDVDQVVAARRPPWCCPRRAPPISDVVAVDSRSGYPLPPSAVEHVRSGVAGRLRWRSQLLPVRIDRRVAAASLYGEVSTRSGRAGSECSGW